MHYDILCFSHLRWHGVYQRPQQILSRLARRRRVFIIEEPEYEDIDSPRLEAIPTGADNVFVFRPRMRVFYPFYIGEQIEQMRALTQLLLKQQRVSRYAVWLYTPMALPIAETCQPLARIFDCMDDLSAFRFAPQELPARDRATMQWADVVFTGGQSLFEARRAQHAHIHCFPSSVDVRHFGSALTDAVREPAWQQSLPHPRLGFFGVIDERMDYEILVALAITHPEWSVILVGPYAKVSPEEVPHYANLYYVGQQPYTELPAYLKGWDVALIPFARNASTRFLSPTKVLEYMAAERLIVATPLPDLLPYGSAVALADSPQDFVTACERVLSASAAQRERWITHMRRMVAGTSWDSTVQQMEALIDRVVGLHLKHRIQRSESPSKESDAVCTSKI